VTLRSVRSNGTLSVDTNPPQLASQRQSLQSIPSNPPLQQVFSNRQPLVNANQATRPESSNVTLRSIPSNRTPSVDMNPPQLASPRQSLQSIPSNSPLQQVFSNRQPLVNANQATRPGSSNGAPSVDMNPPQSASPRQPFQSVLPNPPLQQVFSNRQPLVNANQATRPESSNVTFRSVPSNGTPSVDMNPPQLASPRQPFQSVLPNPPLQQVFSNRQPLVNANQVTRPGSSNGTPSVDMNPPQLASPRQLLQSVPPNPPLQHVFLNRQPLVNTNQATRLEPPDALLRNTISNAAPSVVVDSLQVASPRHVARRGRRNSPLRIGAGSIGKL
jgi:hypothetical protein